MLRCSSLSRCIVVFLNIILFLAHDLLLNFPLALPAIGIRLLHDSFCFSFLLFLIGLSPQVEVEAE